LRFAQEHRSLAHRERRRPAQRRVPLRARRVGVDAEWGANENFAFEFGYIRGLIQAEQHLV